MDLLSLGSFVRIPFAPTSSELPVMRLLCLPCLAMILLLAPDIVSAQGHRSVPVRDPDHHFQRGVTPWTAFRDRSIVKQKLDYSCGAATLATIGRYYWEDDVTEMTFLRGLNKMLTDEEIEDRVKNGLTISDMRRVAVKIGYLASIGKLQWHELVKTKIPLIMPIKTNGHDHFVVYRGSDLDRVYLADPIRGNVRVPIRQFRCEWQKNAVLVMVKRGQKPRTCTPLSITRGDLFLGQMNWQVVRTHDRSLQTIHRLSP